jgi:hypothetical protein
LSNNFTEYYRGEQLKSDLHYRINREKEIIGEKSDMTLHTLVIGCGGGSREDPEPATALENERNNKQNNDGRGLAGEKQKTDEKNV